MEFLAPFDGKATTITTCPGVALASIHLMRARNGLSAYEDRSIDALLCSHELEHMENPGSMLREMPG